MHQKNIYKNFIEALLLIAEIWRKFIKRRIKILIFYIHIME